MKQQLMDFMRWMAVHNRKPYENYEEVVNEYLGSDDKVESSILTPEEIAYKYVHGKHDALTDSQEKKDMADDIKAYADNYSNKQIVSGGAWDLPTGKYVVGVDRAEQGSKDGSCRVWFKTGLNGEMLIVAEEHY